MKCPIIVLFFCATVVLGLEEPRRPLYKYRYQTQDVMQTSASELPVGGYHISEGGYYPDSFRNYIPSQGYGPGPFLGRYTDIDNGRYLGRGYYPGSSFIGPKYGGQGGYYDRNVYNDEKKGVNGESYEKAQGNKGVSAEHGSEGYSQGQVAEKNNKGDSGFYKDEEGSKKAYDDGKSYEGNQHALKEGENGQSQNSKNSHKKGHSTKGFKTSHHKDESGKTETFYDEANDEGDNYNYDGNQGSYAAKDQSSYKGGHENGQYQQDEKAKKGHYDKQHVVDNSNADKGEYGQKGYHGSNEAYNFNNGIGQHSLLGRTEFNRDFRQHHPYGYVPFYSGYY